MNNAGAKKFAQQYRLTEGIKKDTHSIAQFNIKTIA